MRYLFFKIVKLLPLILILLCNSELTAQKVERSVISTGGGITAGKNYAVHGSFGQSAVGITTINVAVQKAGFWHRAAERIKAPGGGSTIAIPVVQGNVGERIEVPLILQQSHHLLQNGAETFEAHIKFNGTVIEPVNEDADYYFEGDSCIMTVTGRLTDTLGILKNIPFRIKLGNAEKTEIRLISFKWNETNDINIVIKHGRLEILNICREGGKLRLVKSGVQASLMNTYPNPAQDQVNIEFSLNEKGMTSLYLVDNYGKKLKDLYRANAAPGEHQFEAELDNVPSGAYFLVLLTPNEIYAKRLIIKK